MITRASHGWRLARQALVLLLLVVAGEPGRDGGGTMARAQGAEAAAEVLLAGKTVERSLTLGEPQTFLLELDADQTARLKLEKRGVAAVVTLFAPDGEKVGTYGSAALSEGTEEISFMSGQAGTYRLQVRTFFKPSPPGRYSITLAGAHAASERERSERARRSCQEGDWFDREGNFLVDDALASLSGCMAAVGNRLDDDFPQAAGLAAGARAEIAYLQESWHWGEFVSPAYQDSLIDDFRVLAAAAAEPRAKKAFAMMEAVVDDLKIKADHCRKTDRGLGEDVKVEVKTMKSTRQDPGWVVYYKLGIFEFAEGRKPNRFTELSSPTSGKLPAGRYLMWAWKPGMAEAAPRKELFRIGGGAKELTLDLLVP